MKYIKKTIFFLIVFLLVTNLFAYDFNDAIMNVAPRKQGYEYSIDFMSLLHKVFAQYENDKQIEEFLVFWFECLKSFDFATLYNSPFLSPLENDYRGVVFQGLNLPDMYYITLVSSKDDQSEFSQIGNMMAEFALKKNKKSFVGERSYSGHIDAMASLKHLSNDNIDSLMEGFLKVVDPQNIKTLKEPECNLLKNINNNSRPVINTFYKSFPRSLDLVDRYLIVHSTFETKTFEGIDYTHMKMHFSFRFENLENDYPNISDYLHRLRDLFRFELVVKTKTGNNIMLGIVDSKKDKPNIIGEFYTRKGMVIPYDSDGNPVFSEEYSITKLTDFKFDSELSIFFNIYGLKFETEKIKINNEYIDSEKKSSFSVRLQDINKTKVYGRAYHIVPTWFIDMIIPSNIDELIYKFSQVMLHANNGQGTSVFFEWDKKDKNNIMLYHKNSSEFVDNFFILFGFQVWREKFKLSDETASELHSVIVRIIASVVSDLKSSRKLVQGPN